MNSHSSNRLLTSKLGRCELVLLAAIPLFSQNSSVRSTVEKITGDEYREFSAQAYRSAAYANAAALNEYARRYSYIPSETANEHAAEVRRNVTAAKSEVAKLASRVKQDKAVAKHVRTLYAYYDKVLERCSMLEGECAKEKDADGRRVGRCCAVITETLKAADAEHTKLSKYLKSS